MSTISTKPPSGMRDFLPDEMARRRHVIRKIELAYEQHGFLPLETPSIENLSTLTGKYGEEGDQLLYRLLHRRDALTRALEKENLSQEDLADLGLRYDLTVPLARVAANYRSDLPRIFRRYQIQPVWRADRPAKGRFREFFQCDIDIIGSSSAIAEAEVCSAAATALQAIGIENYHYEFNDRRFLQALIRNAGIDLSLETPALVALDKLDKIGPDKVQTELEARGVPTPGAKQLLEWVAEPGDMQRFAALFKDDADKALIDEMAKVYAAIEATPAGAHVRFNPALARGLSYYTGAIFEITSPDYKGSLGGGGRYDGLIGMFSKEQIPAVGFSLGLERLMLIVAEQEQQTTPRPHVIVCRIGTPAVDGLKVVTELRSTGVSAELYAGDGKLGKQIQHATHAQINASHVALLGEDELNAGTVTLKELATGEQETISIGDVNARIAPDE